MSRPGMTARRAATALLSVTLAAALGAAPGPAGALGHDPRGDRTAGAVHSLRSPVTDETFYFVMADRFANGSTANDRGGLPDDPLVSGFDPTRTGFYQGGDLRGILAHLDYVQGLGTTSIWLTPSFANKAVQPEDDSAGYHGYWVTDFTRIDPHLGTNEDLRALVDAAHDRGMKVYFDIITNHTADVLGYESGARQPYVAKDVRPYRTAAGEPFDDRDVAGSDAFPALDPATSFPYVPVLERGEEDLKVPAWLNDPTLYHNRGDTTFVGEDSQYGDFFGLDDLFTEHPRVVAGMIDIYRTWIADHGIDGFRIDTMKHVDDEFWRAFGPAVLEYAHEQGKDEFFMFGEVLDGSRPFTSAYTTRAGVQAVLDFPFQGAARDFASRGTSAAALEAFFAADDWYTDADSNVYALPTFLGNHDIGRIGAMVQADNPGAGDAEWLARDRLAHELMYLSRGNPVVFYGDEQGFTGTTTDQGARQTMFASRVPAYLDDDLLGTGATHAEDRFDRAHPLYTTIAALARLTREHPALRDGAHQNRYASDGPGVYAFSRIDREHEREYVVALNNSDAAQTVDVPTWVGRSGFQRLYGEGPERLRSARDGTLTLTVPPLSAVVLRAAAKMDRARAVPAVTLAEPTPAEGARGRLHLSARVAGDHFAEVTFQVRGADGAWTNVGTDDTRPYGVFHDVSDRAPGTALTYRAVVMDVRERTRASAPAAASVPAPALTIRTPAAGAFVEGTVDVQVVADPERATHVVTIERSVGGGDWTTVRTDDSSPVYTARDDVADLPEGTSVRYRAVLVDGATTVTSAVRSVTAGVSRPDAVSIPGSLNSEMGCPGDWDPACDAAQMTHDPVADVWRLAVALPAGPYEYKVAIDRSWDENYGADGRRDGGNIALTLAADATVTFTYDHATHRVTAELADTAG